MRQDRNRLQHRPVNYYIANHVEFGTCEQDKALRADVHVVFFFQAEDGIRDLTVTGVQTCALPIYVASMPHCIRVIASSLQKLSEKRRFFGLFITYFVKIGSCNLAFSCILMLYFL